MYTQHPDNAAKPYWHTHASVRTHEETKECASVLSDYGAYEYMWDWEGKLVDESVIERLYGKYHDFFLKKQIGKDVFVTFRIPNPRVESGFRLGKAYLTILAAEALASRGKLHTPPLFEVILPLTESASDIIQVQTTFAQLASIMHDSFDLAHTSLDPIEVIPLFEKVDTIMRSADILTEYVSAYVKTFGKIPTYIRPFCARSDPALNSGIVAPSLAIKCALSDYRTWTMHTGIQTYPIIGPGALPFRGGFNPDTAEEFVREFAGVRTVLVQSAFRYDYPRAQVKRAIEKISRVAPLLEAKTIDIQTRKIIEQIIPQFETPYQHTVELLAPAIQRLAPHIPSRRERVQHVGLFGYSRSMGRVQLPRAIGFTACCYSLGLPPELFGIGEGLRSLNKTQQEVLEKIFPTLPLLLERAGRYFCAESVEKYRINNFEKNIKTIESYIGKKLGPRTTAEQAHANIVRQITSCHSNTKVSILIEKAALLRKSIG
jgi:phosphoenolpyruvate carboxylase